MDRWGKWERRPAADLTPMAAAAAAVVSVSPPQHQDTLSWRSKESTSSQRVHSTHIYIENHSVCHHVGIGTSPPPSPKSKFAPPEPKGGGGEGGIRACGGGGGGDPITTKLIALCLLYDTVDCLVL